jgi:hypothetical protein
VRLAGIPANRQRQPVHFLPIIATTVVRHNRRGHAQCCVHTHSPVDSPTHPPGVRAMAWLTGSVQGTLFGNWLLCLFSCTFPAPLVTSLQGVEQHSCRQIPGFVPISLSSLPPSSGPLQSLTKWIHIRIH